MAAPMKKTRHAGIWKRGGRYVFSYRLNGKQRWESARTLSEAQRLKARRSADADRGELHERSRLTFREYAGEWVESYTGRGRSGFRGSTREGYRHDLTQWVFPYWGDERKLTEVTPRDVAQLVSHLTQQTGKSGRPLADNTVRNIVNPVRACLVTAVEDGLIRVNPAQRVRLPHREKPEDEDGEDVRPFTREQLAAVLAHVHPRHRLMFRVLAATGLRVSELLALQWRHLKLDGERPCVRVRRATCATASSRRRRSTASVTCRLSGRLSTTSAPTARQPSGRARRTSCSRLCAARRSRSRTCDGVCSHPSSRRPVLPGQAFIASATPARRCCLSGQN